jgi:hypothetical protein
MRFWKLGMKGDALGKTLIEIRLDDRFLAVGGSALGVLSVNIRAKKYAECPNVS